MAGFSRPTRTNHRAAQRLGSACPAGRQPARANPFPASAGWYVGCFWRLGMAAELRSDRLPRNAAPVAEVGLEELARSADRLPLRDFLAIAEAWRIARALRDHRGNRSAAARSLGIGRRTLYTKMEKLGISEAWYSPRLHGLRP